MRILKRNGRTPLYDEHLTFFTLVEGAGSSVGWSRPRSPRSGTT
jgi:hypothetical protein